MSNIKERILQLAKLKGISKENFCEKIEMSYSNFKSSAKNTPLNSDAIGKILSLYPDVSADWLITGKGEVLRGTADESLMTLFERGLIDRVLVEQFKPQYLAALSTDKSIHDFFASIDKSKILELVNQHPYYYREKPAFDNDDEQWDLLERIGKLLYNCGYSYFLQNLQGKQKERFEELLQKFDGNFLDRLKRSELIIPIVNKGIKSETYPSFIFDLLKKSIEINWLSYITPNKLIVELQQKLWAIEEEAKKSSTFAH